MPTRDERKEVSATVADGRREGGSRDEEVLVRGVAARGTAEEEEEETTAGERDGTLTVRAGRAAVGGEEEMGWKGKRDGW